MGGGAKGKGATTVNELELTGTSQQPPTSHIVDYSQAHAPPRTPPIHPTSDVAHHGRRRS